MKKIFLSVVMSALFLIGSLSMIIMSPPPAPNSQCVKIAEEFAPQLEELGISRTEFISSCNVCENKSQSEGNTAACRCKFLTAIDVAPGDNFGKCVNIVKNGEGGGIPE